ncbi:MAG: Unknown protein [uncultured Sulfurovum sp.]|uniref:Uncharacterized protein n=1 Tax=uncultured Sulfurovum sp. TaxID=269237 RepID=A0A6S6SV79_9BACT|nr:MAG: Unknown protein [uncultured Sulfurovum sp.]
MSAYNIDSLEACELRDLRAVNLISKNGYIDEYEVKSFIFPNEVRIVSIDVLNYLLAKIIDERDVEIDKNKQFKKTESASKQLKEKIETQKSEIELLKKIAKEYEKTYGKYISPFTIVEEFYRGVRLPYMVLKKRDEFKIKVSEKQFKYWSGILTDLGVVRPLDKSRFQSLVSYQDAHDILYKNDYIWKGKKMKDDQIGYVDDNVTNGQDHNDNDEEEITEWYEEELTK